MKRLIAVTAFLFFASVTAAQAEMVKIYGPVYIAKSKAEHAEKEHVKKHGKKEHKNHEEEDHGQMSTAFQFNAPVPGNGVFVITNGGDSGKSARVPVAEVSLNGSQVTTPRTFNRSVEEKKYDVTLLESNEVSVSIRGCGSCELAITVYGEQPVAPPPPVIAPPPPPPPAIAPPRF